MEKLLRQSESRSHAFAAGPFSCVRGSTLWLFRVYSEAVAREFWPEQELVTHMKTPSLILASGSPRRAELLRGAGVDFKIVTSDAPEIHPEELTATEMSQVNAYRKARGVAKKHPDALVLGADTLVFMGLAVFGKPSTLEHAYQMLERLQGQTHQVVTAVCLLHLREHRQRLFAVHTAVTFRPLDAVAIRKYLTHVDPMDKAGAYAIQEHGDWIVAEVSGSYSNVIGLPIEAVTQELEAFPQRQRAVA